MLNFVTGQPYTIKATVTNASTKAGLPVEATLVINISLTGVNVAPISKTQVFPAGETLVFTTDITIPVGPVYDPKYDLDDDGAITPADLTILEKIIAHIITDPALVAKADFNGDGKVNASDITSLERYMGMMSTNKITATVSDPNGNILASTQADFQVTVA